MIKVKALLELYDPEEPDNLAANLLQQRFGDKPVIAFKPGTRDVATGETRNISKTFDAVIPKLYR